MADEMVALMAGMMADWKDFQLVAKRVALWVEKRVAN